MTAHQTSAIESDADFGATCATFEADSSTELSAYHYELEWYLALVERAITHYEVLGVDYLATNGEITAAYLRGIILLDPVACGIESDLIDELQSRVSVVSERVSTAFNTLMNFDSRSEYDGRLFGWDNKEQESRKPFQRQSTKPNCDGKDKNENRRVNQRFELSIPVAVTGFDEGGIDWHEAVQSVDLSRSGCCLLLRRRLQVGSVLYLRMPMPLVLRSHEFLDQTYGTYAIVRWIRPPRDGFRVVGVQFIGEFPPPGFRQHPWATFSINTWDGRDRRTEARESVSEAIEIEYFDESEQLIRKGFGFIEDISTGGVRVCSERPPLESDFLRIIRPKLCLSAFALVRNRYKGRDGYERICAQFIG